MKTQVISSKIVLLFMLTLFGCKHELCVQPISGVSELVNPFIGTDYVGNTYPGAQYPFGMVQLSPDNGLPGWDRIAGYYYPDSTIAGFSHTHLQGTGAGDLYDISFMPTCGKLSYSDSIIGVFSKFSHSKEKANAGYYSVVLDDYSIFVELSATARTGVQLYHFYNMNDTARIILNLAKSMNWDNTIETHVELLNSQMIVGYRYSTGWAKDQKVYFATSLSMPMDSLDTHFKENYPLYQSMQGDVVALCYNKTPKNLMVQTAISSVSIDSAIKTLKKEKVNDFNTVRQSTEKKWNSVLSCVNISSDNDSLLSIFYTALYHSFTCPTLFSDHEGNYMGADRLVHNATKEFDTPTTIYSTFSLWDTYRAAHPLYTLLQPNIVGDLAKSLLIQYREIGRLPVWNFYGNETDMMIGYHSVPVIVDAYLKGFVEYSLGNELLEACVATANVPNYRGLDMYKKLGYVPCHLENESVSKTLEYAYDDACIFELASFLAKQTTNDSLKNHYSFIANVFKKRSLNYNNLWNHSTSFFQPRTLSGEWKKNFNPQEYSYDITESNAWQYLWSVQHDVDGLMQLMGGMEQMSSKLDTFFYTKTNDSIELPLFSTGMIGQYAHGNEPSHHAIFLYNKVDKPWKIVPIQNRIMDSFYTNQPSGLCGNEDCGQMSAWYVWCAIGMYPLDPVSGEYEIVKPLFDSLIINLDNNKLIDVKVHSHSENERYIKRVLWNGKSLNKSSISHLELVKGGCLEYELTDEKGICWWNN